MKKYGHKGETFEVSEPQDCQMKVGGMGETGTIHLDEKTRQYSGAVLGFTASFDDLSTTLYWLCSTIYDKKRVQPPADVLCKQMDEFYDKLPS